jgi:hypothetical protein
MRSRCQIELTSSVAFDRTANGCDREREKIMDNINIICIYVKTLRQKPTDHKLPRTVRTVCLKCKEFQTPRYTKYIVMIQELFY